MILLHNNFKSYRTSSKSRRTSNYCRPQNLAAHFRGWVTINAALEMTLHGKGSIKFKVLTMWIRTGSATRAILRMTTNSKLDTSRQLPIVSRITDSI